MAHGVQNLALFTFLAVAMSLKEGLTIVGETEMFTFPALLMPLKEGATRVGKTQDQLTLRLSHLVVKI